MDSHNNSPGFMNRELHREILLEMQMVYPRQKDYQHLKKEGNTDKICALAYLAGHGLINVVWSREISDPFNPLWASITVQGLDFIADDGGLSGILNVVTVKLHAETIRDLLIKKIESTSIPAAKRSSLIQAIRNLPGRALEKLTDKMLDSGADFLVGKAHELGTLLDQL